MSQLAGQQWGNYHLTKLLGHGGVAEVYQGKHIRLGMYVAIKILHTHLNDEEIQAFQKEAQTIADLRHPDIIHILDFDVRDGRPFFIMDYTSHGSLSQKHPYGTRLPLPLVVSYIGQIASALQYAHEHKLIHRDIKPANILLGEHDKLLLSDFGITTIAHSTSSMNTQAASGTLAYMAPEQIQGKPCTASDQYSLAVTAYQWLSGVMPFQGSSTEIIAQHMTTRPPSLRAKMPDIPEEIEQVIMTALNKEPQERFSTVRAFANALAQASGILVEQKQSTTAIPTIGTASTLAEIPSMEIPMTEDNPPTTTPIQPPAQAIPMPSNHPGTYSPQLYVGTLTQIPSYTPTHRKRPLLFASMIAAAIQLSLMLILEFADRAQILILGMGMRFSNILYLSITSFDFYFVADMFRQEGAASLLIACFSLLFVISGSADFFVGYFVTKHTGKMSSSLLACFLSKYLFFTAFFLLDAALYFVLTTPDSYAVSFFDYLGPTLIFMVLFFLISTITILLFGTLGGAISKGQAQRK